MKTKKEKKLDLNKTTLMNLDDSILKNVKGGETFIIPSVTSSCKFLCG